MSTSIETHVVPDTISKDNVEILRQNASIRLTDKVRALDLGVIAFAWAVLSAEKPPVSQINLLHHVWLLVTVFLAVLSLLLDLLQSIGNYVEFTRLRRKMSDEGQEQGTFDQKSLLYRSQNWASWLKIAICVVSCVLLLALVVTTF